MAIHPFNQRYKDKILDAPYEICIERARYYTESFKLTKGQHPALRAAKALRHTLENMTLSIVEGEQIIGNRSSKLVGVIIPVERGDVNLILDMELDFLLNRKSQPFHIDTADRRLLENEILPYWKNRSVRAKKKILYKKNGLVFTPALNPFSIYKRIKALDLSRLKSATAVPGANLAYSIRGAKELMHNNPAMVMDIFDMQGHLILGLKNILCDGFVGTRMQAVTRLEKARKDNDRDGASFLEAVIISCDAIETLANRFADYAVNTAKSESGPDRKKTLMEIAARCRHAPMNPPRDFREAVQSLWLIMVGGLVSHGMVGILAVGRFDQYLNPYFIKDKAKGKITDKQAIQLMEELLIKLGSNLMVLPYVGKNTGNELGSDSCVPTVGGVDEDGNDAVNELSYLILDAFSNIKSMGNSFSIRLSEKSPKKFWKKALATYRQTSGAALFNDEIVIPALVKCGMPEEKARDYGIIGCVEPTGDGNTFGCTSGNDISFTGALEMTLKNGYLRIMGKRIGPKTGDPRRFQTFDQFMDAFKQQISFMVNTVAKAVNLKDKVYMEGFHNPYISATLSGCIENARDMTCGGADFNFNSISGRGLGTVVDSLAAIKYFIYDEKTFSMSQIIRMLDNNFKGFEKERSILYYKGPKYGADNDYADEIAREVCGFFCCSVAEKQTNRGGPFRPSFFSYGMHVLEGLYVGATPNGRVSGDPVSNSLSPSNGAEKKGPAGVLRSVSKLDHTLIANGCAVNIKLMPSMFKGEERLNKMVGLVKGYFSMGGMELQPNVVSNQILKDAQNHPENYRDLVIRVSGYSAIFTDLGKPLQDEIISRTEFEHI